MPTKSIIQIQQVHHPIGFDVAAFGSAVAAPLLAFAKSDRTDATHIAARGVASDQIALNTMCGLMAWVLPTAPFVVDGVVWGSTHQPAGFPNPSDLCVILFDNASGGMQSRVNQNTVQNLRIATHTWTGGDFYTHGEFTAWFGGHQQSYPAVWAGVNDDTMGSLSFAGPVWPATPDYLKIANGNGGAGGAGQLPFQGMVLRPLFLTGLATGYKEMFPAYYADGAAGAAPVYSEATLQAAPYPKAGTEGTALTAWAVDPSGAAISGVAPVGLPAFYAGPGEGFDTTDEHYIRGDAFPGGTVAPPVTVLIKVDGTAQATVLANFFSQASSITLGGFRLAARTAGTAFDIDAADAAGTTVLNSNSSNAGTILVTDTFWYVATIDSAGTDVNLYHFTAAGVEDSAANRTATGAIALNQGYNLGRGRVGAGNGAYTAAVGSILEAIVIMAELTSAQITDIIDGTDADPATTHSAAMHRVAGVGSDIEDQADILRGDGKTRFWGVYDPLGVYGDPMTCEVVTIP